MNIFVRHYNEQHSSSGLLQQICDVNYGRTGIPASYNAHYKAGTSGARNQCINSNRAYMRANYYRAP